MNKIIILLIIYYIYINIILLFYTNSTYELKNDLDLKKNELLVCILMNIWIYFYC